MWDELLIHSQISTVQRYKRNGSDTAAGIVLVPIAFPYSIIVSPRDQSHEGFFHWYVKLDGSITLPSLLCWLPVRCLLCYGMRFSYDGYKNAVMTYLDACKRSLHGICNADENC